MYTFLHSLKGTNHNFEISEQVETNYSAHAIINVFLNHFLKKSSVKLIQDYLFLDSEFRCFRGLYVRNGIEGTWYHS